MTRRGFAAIREIFSTTYRLGHFNPDYTLYRPLSKAAFAIEWQLWPNNPAPGHFVNALLYALTGFVLFYCLSLYFKGNLLTAFLASSLFVAHPIHTEVVANIKSLDEILCFLFFVITAIFIYRYVSKAAMRDLIVALAAFSLSLFSKESGVTFIVVIPMMIWFFTDAHRSKILVVTGAIVLVALIFLIVRAGVINAVSGHSQLSEQIIVIDNVMAGQTMVQRFPTAVFIMGLYLKLLLFPHPLASDYSFNQIPLSGFGDWKFLLSLAVFAGLAVYALIRTRRKDPIAFGLLYFFVTASVAANILVLIGTSFGERLMYAPSLGFCIAIAFLIVRVTGRVSEQKQAIPDLGAFFTGHSRTIGLVTVILLLYSVKTIARNRDWRDNLTLYSADVKTSPRSARTHYYLGNHLSQDERLLKLGRSSPQAASSLDLALTELTTATQIYPDYADAYQQMAKIYLERKDFVKADEYYRKALAFKPNNPVYLSNYGNALFNTGRLEDAKKEFEEAIRWNPAYARAYHNLGSVYGAMGDGARAIGNEEAAKQNFGKAILNFKKAIDFDPDYSPAYRFLGVTYRNLGDESNGQFYLNKWKELDDREKK